MTEDAAPLEESGLDEDACGGEAAGCPVEAVALASERHGGPPEDAIEFSRRTGDLMVPLSNFRVECAMCHAAFDGLPATAWVGALVLRVPIAD